MIPILEILWQKDNSDYKNPMSYVFQQDTPYVPISNSPIPICDIYDLESLVFSNKQKSKFLFLIFDLRVPEIEKLQFC